MTLESSDTIATIALLVSLIALGTTVLQVLQQYFSSAEGFRRCAKSVMGEWANQTKRLFRRSEFRFEVVYESPVIFLAHPNNKRGPIVGRDVFYINGFPKSYKNTRVLQPDAQKKQDQETAQKIHTADDEKASWVTLLQSLQLVESESRKWEEGHLQTPRGLRTYSEPKYTLAVAVQAKARSWDFMPPSISKPFATTTICHLVEMTAVLGMVWKLFDQTNWNLRAEGNGFIITSTQVQGLGVMITFSVTGRHAFEDTRLIPNEMAKELCFGRLPTFYHVVEEISDSSVSHTLPKKAHTPSDGSSPKAPPDLHPPLLFGDDDEIVQTLLVLGVTRVNARNYATSHTHLFSIAFEIMGMLGSCLRIRLSNFKRIPNPTTEHFNTDFSRMKLMNAFMDQLINLVKSNPSTQRQKEVLGWKNTWDFLRCDETHLTTDLREAAHNALDNATDFLRGIEDHRIVIRVVGTHLNAVLSSIHDLEIMFNEELGEDKERLLMEHYFENVRKSVMDSRRKSDKLNESGTAMDQKGDIWITLIFRMMCWLLLHDVDKNQAVQSVSQSAIS